MNRLSLLTLKIIASLLLICTSALAADVDLQLSSYLVSPDPVINGGTTTFDLTVQNNGPATSAASTLVVVPPSNVTYQSNASGCTYANSQLTCSVSALALGETAAFSYTAIGTGAGVETTSATITADTGDNDTNLANNSLDKNITSIKGADLTVINTGQDGCTNNCSTTAGSNYTFALKVTNNGPDPATTFQIVDNLPANSDFTYQSASGSGWSCSHSGTTLTCDYSGADIASESDAPVITVTGQVITTAGTITNGVSVRSTDVATGDPDQTNNGPDQLTVTVTAGTNLRANKTMRSHNTNLTTFIPGEAVTLTLSATNTGTQDATGVEITDTVPADFSIGVLPAGCTNDTQDITCIAGDLSAGDTSANFTIPLTVTGTSGTNGSNTAQVTRTTPTAGSNTPATANYSIVEPFSRLTISKTKVALDDNSPGGNDPVQSGQKILNTVVVSNSSNSTSAATGTVTVQETLLDHPNEKFDALTAAATAAGWVCEDADGGDNGGPVMNCTFAISGSLARGAALPNLGFTTIAVGEDMNLRNQVCTGGDISAHEPGDDDSIAECSNIRSIYSAPDDVDIGITKIVNDNSIDVNESQFTYTVEVTNHSVSTTAPTVVVTDAIPMFYNGPAGTTPITPTLVSQGAGESCSVSASGVVTCTMKDIAAGATRTINIQVERPVKDGNFTNTASWDSPDLVQTVNTAPDSASVDVDIDPIADVAVTGIAAAPDPYMVSPLYARAYLRKMTGTGLLPYIRPLFERT